MSGAARQGVLEEAIESAVRRALEEPLRALAVALERLQPTGSDDLLDIASAAALLGYSVRTLRAKANRREVPASKPPGSREWRFRRGSLLSWMERRSEGVLDMETEARKIAGRLKRGG